jgi:hypothetical protein
MQQAASEVKTAYPDKKLTTKKFAAWVGLATQSTAGYTLPHGLVSLA